MLLLFSAEEVTVAFPSQVLAVCVGMRETERKGKGKGEVEKRVGFCTYVGNVEKKNFFVLVEYILYI